MSVEIDTKEVVRITLDLEEFTRCLFTDQHLDYSELVHRGRLLDIPDAWHLVNIRFDYDAAEATLAFSYSETTRLLRGASNETR